MRVHAGVRAGLRGVARVCLGVFECGTRYSEAAGEKIMAVEQPTWWNVRLECSIGMVDGMIDWSMEIFNGVNDGNV